MHSSASFCAMAAAGNDVRILSHSGNVALRSFATFPCCGFASHLMESWQSASGRMSCSEYGSIR